MTFLQAITLAREVEILDFNCFPPGEDRLLTKLPNRREKEENIVSVSLLELTQVVEQIPRGILIRFKRL